MKAHGSRTDGTGDAFSDYDYLIESADDFEAVRAAAKNALIWHYTDAKFFRVLALVMPDGTMVDYSENAGGFEAQWSPFAAQAEPKLRDYWIIMFKHLKAAYRGYWLALDFGIEMSSGLARDIYMEKHYGITQPVRNFFAYKQIAERVAGDTVISRITGMPYATKAEKFAKLRALNALMMSLPRGDLADPTPVFETRAKLIGWDYEIPLPLGGVRGGMATCDKPSPSAARSAPPRGRGK